MVAADRGWRQTSRAPRDVGAWLATLLVVDAALIAGDILRRHDILASMQFSIGRERGYAEMFQYAKLAAIGLLLFWSGLKWRSRADLFWGSSSSTWSLTMRSLRTSEPVSSSPVCCRCRRLAVPPLVRSANCSS
jgi:hypothetical protein